MKEAREVSPCNWEREIGDCGGKRGGKQEKEEDIQ
jgi:hypothetical protein